VNPRPSDRLTLESFLYDFFLARFGTSFVAEAHITALYTSLQRLYEENKKIGMFARLLGVVKPLPEVCSSAVPKRRPAN
jgi:hypothetical protein